MLNTSLKLAQGMWSVFGAIHALNLLKCLKKNLLNRLIGIKLFSLLYVVFVSCDLFNLKVKCLWQFKCKLIFKDNLKISYFCFVFVIK